MKRPEFLGRASVAEQVEKSNLSGFLKSFYKNLNIQEEKESSGLQPVKKFSEVVTGEEFENNGLGNNICDVLFGIDSKLPGKIEVTAGETSLRVETFEKKDCKKALLVFYFTPDNTLIKHLYEFNNHIKNFQHTYKDIKINDCLAVAKTIETILKTK